MTKAAEDSDSKEREVLGEAEAGLYGGWLWQLVPEFTDWLTVVAHKVFGCRLKPEDWVLLDDREQRQLRALRQLGRKQRRWKAICPGCGHLHHYHQEIES